MISGVPAERARLRAPTCLSPAHPVTSDGAFVPPEGALGGGEAAGRLELALDNAAREFPWIEELRDRSVTELEVRATPVPSR